MFDNFDYEIAKIFKMAEKQMQELHHPYVGSEHLLLALLKNQDELTQTLNQAGLTYEKFRKELIKLVGMGKGVSQTFLYTPLLKRVIENSLINAKEDNQGIVTTTNLFISLLEESEGIAIRIMISLDIDLDALYKKLNSISYKHLLIYEIGNNLNEKVAMDEKVVGRDEELNFIMETLLRKNKNNPLLVGPAGTGKTAIVEQLARKINLQDVPQELLDKKIIELNMAYLVAGTKYRGEFEEKLNKIIEELNAQKNIILFIDEIHTIINAGGAEGAIDASNILKPYLARGTIKCIGATTTQEYNKSIAKDKALDRRFQKIIINEPNTEQTIFILKSIKDEYEKHHHLKISDKNIEDIVSLANKYIYNKNNPDKCIDLLDSVCASVKLKNNKYFIQDKKDLENIHVLKKESIIKQDYDKALKLKKQEDRLSNTHKVGKLNTISKKDIVKVIENKTNMNILNDKKKVYQTLKKQLYTNIIAQDKAIEKILLTYRLREDSKPLSYLLSGPTGVGKTYTVKLFAKALGVNLIRLDMSEYNNEITANKLLGSPAGYVGYNDTYVFKEIIEHPFSVILLDEIEKASPKIINLFLQILDEGFLTGNDNEKINFKNTIIFMTSNECANNSLGFASKHIDNAYLNKEILNRIDAIVNFENVDLNSAKKYLRFKHMETNLEKILEISNYEQYGFRDLNRCIKAVEKNLVK